MSKISPQHPRSTSKYSALWIGSVWFSYSIRVDFVIWLEYQIKYYSMFLPGAADVDICGTVFWQCLYLVAKNCKFSEFFSERNLNFFILIQHENKRWNASVFLRVEILTSCNYNCPKLFCFWSQRERQQLEYASLHIVVLLIFTAYAFHLSNFP